MSNLLIHSAQTVTIQYAEIFCNNNGQNAQYRVFMNGYIVKGIYSESEDSQFNWKFDDFNSDEPNYEEIKKIGLELLGAG